MVYLDAQGQANPVLKANVGETVEITISSGEGAEHDIVFPGLKCIPTVQRSSVRSRYAR